MIKSLRNLFHQSGVVLLAKCSAAAWTTCTSGRRGLVYQLTVLASGQLFMLMDHTLWSQSWLGHLIRQSLGQKNVMAKTKKAETMAPNMGRKQIKSAHKGSTRDWQLLGTSLSSA